MEINEQKIDLLLDMMRSADVTDGNQAESETLLEMEGETPASLLHSLHCMGSVEWGVIAGFHIVSYRRGEGGGGHWDLPPPPRI